ncbi:hypothetical protein JTB14_037140 [Gonioctena quinquepunctata]|nr:hypothetical protein JTB14_037140 [Gonioctena quinquepunctata]
METVTTNDIDNSLKENTKNNVEIELPCLNADNDDWIAVKNPKPKIIRSKRDRKTMEKSDDSETSPSDSDSNGSISELSSDYNPVSIISGQGRSAQVDSYYETTDWENFKLCLTNEYCAPESIESPDELDNALKKFEETITKNFYDCSINIKKNPPNYNTSPPNVKLLIRKKNRAKRRYQASLAGNDKIFYNSSNQRVENAIKMFNNDGWEKTPEEINPNDPNETWELVRKLKNKKVN